jgi:RNA polymerase sigma-70 factor (ECF subfamily)
MRCHFDGRVNLTTPPTVEDDRMTMSDDARALSSPDDFDAFFYALLPQVLRVAERMTGDHATAEDVAGEAFARAFARWPKLKVLPHREAWVLRVASNVAIDLFRRRRLPMTTAGARSDPAEVVVLRASLVEALRSIPKRHREAVVLRYLADLSEAEVAVALGVRPGTVKSQLHRARRSLVDRLGADPEEVPI